MLPWTGFELEPNGDVKNCIISKEVLGNINDTDIQDIMSNAQNLKLKKDISEFDPEKSIASLPILLK